MFENHSFQKLTYFARLVKHHIGGAEVSVNDIFWMKIAETLANVFSNHSSVLQARGRLGNVLV